MTDTFGGEMAEKKNKNWENKVKASHQQAIIYAQELNILYKKEQERRKALEEALIKLKETQEELVQSAKLAAVGQLAAGVAHEINGPLMAIIGYADLLKSKAKDDDGQQKWLGIISSESERISGIVKELLSFSRKSEPKFTLSSINDIIEATLLITEHTLSRYKGVKVNTKLSPSLPSVYADKGQLQQVFMNLILNAAQAMPEGGELTIRTKCDEKSIVIEFEDTGCGISKENLKKIFSSFFTTKGEGKGTGLGLSIVKGIVEKHKGEISVESEEGVGTTFKVCLPAGNDRS